MAGATAVTGQRSADAGNSNIVIWRQQRQRLQQQLQQTACDSLLCQSDRELDQRLGLLCNELMDYLATGHGCIYARCGGASIRLQAELSEENLLLHDIWHNLGRNTDAALRFNRRCETTPLATLQQQLQSELGKLSKMLSLRFALEEQLLELAAQVPSSRGE